MNSHWSESTHWYDARRARFWGIIGVLVTVILIVGGGLAYWKWPSINRVLRAGEVEALAVEAKRLVADGEYGLAREKVLQAMEINRNHPEAIRAAAALMGRSNPAEATRILQGLRARGEVLLEDRLTLFELLIRQERFREARELRSRLELEVPGDVRVVFLSAKLSLAEGDEASFEQLARRTIELKPDHFEARLLLAHRQIDSVIPEIAEQGWKVIEELAELPGREGLTALFLIKDRGSHFVKDHARYFELFRDHPDRSVGAEEEPTIDVLQWELAIRPLDEKRIIEAAIERWAVVGGKMFSSRLSWLNLNGYSDYVREYSEKRGEKGDPALLGSRIEAALMNGDTAAALEEIEAAELTGGEKGRIEFARALVALDDGQPLEEVLRAFELASKTALENGDQAMVNRAGQVALMLGELKAAEVVFRALRNVAPSKAHQGLAMIAEREGDYYNVLDHMEALSALEPGLPDVAQRTAYLQLLLNRHADEAKDTANRLNALNPDDPSVGLLMALSEYRNLTFDRAKERCAAINLGRLKEGQQAVVAAIYGAAGDRERAEEILGSVSAFRLNAAEKEFLVKAGVKLDDSE
ncbi:MAG: hypothetical protein AAGD22_04310 [Verrucomicrobiota bacterium]